MTTRSLAELREAKAPLSEQLMALEWEQCGCCSGWAESLAALAAELEARLASVRNFVPMVDVEFDGDHLSHGTMSQWWSRGYERGCDDTTAAIRALVDDEGGNR